MGINMHKKEIVLLLFALSVTSNIKIRCLKLWNIPKWITLWVVSFTTLSAPALCKCSTHCVHLAVPQHRHFPLASMCWAGISSECVLFSTATLHCLSRGQKLERLEMRATVEEMKTFIRLEVLPPPLPFSWDSLCLAGLSLPSARIAGMYHYIWLPCPFP